jgi:aminomethyltransferase
MAHDTALSRTPLYSLHTELGARMVPFSGWEMPVQYSGITKEHQAVREQSGIFDISHMGKFVLTGKGVMAALEQLVPSDLSRLQAGAAQYTVLLNDQGGVVDDLIIYPQGEDQDGNEVVTIIVNAATMQKDYDWMTSHMNLDAITLTNLSEQRSLLAIQGPQAVQILQSMTEDKIADLPRFGHLTGKILGQPAFFARTGYTGEDGFEVMLDPKAAMELWRSLLTKGVTPCGLGARDTLRLEAAMALYGQDMTDQTSPLEAGLGWLVHLDRKGEFIGRSVLEAQKREGVTRRLVGLQMAGRTIARHDYPVVQNGVSVGIVTSGTLSPTLGVAIALAYVPIAMANIGQQVEVEVRGKVYEATVVKRPFYRAAAL